MGSLPRSWSISQPSNGARRKKTEAKRPSPSEAIETARRLINAAIDEAERVAGPAALTTLLQNLLANRRYCDAVGAPGPHVIRVEAPPSCGTVQQIRDLIRGNI